jgi:hypothetical protein
MVQKAGIFLVKLIIILLFCAFGIALGFTAAGYWAKLDYAGAFVKWQLLDNPQKFRQFVYANESEIWAFAENGMFYMYKSDFCDDTPGEVCGEWMELDPHGEFDSGIKNVINSGCEATFDYYSVETRYPPKTEASPTECVITQAHDPFFGTTTLTYYVLLDDGKVWMWKHKPDFEKIPIISLSLNLTGLMIGIIAWLFFRKRFAYFVDKDLGVTQ